VSKWKDHISEDPRYLFDAATQASKNVDYLLNLIGLQR
jgi:antirestriction protein ArdC